MTSREIIRRVLAHDHPPRIGFAYSGYEGEARLNDIAYVGPAADPNFDEQRHLDDGGGEIWTDEWGCVWRRLVGRTAGGEVIEPPIRTWDDLDTYRLPSYGDPARYAHGRETREKCPDHYLLGGISACCFNAARYLRRLEQYLEDCAGEPAKIRRLNTMVEDLVAAEVDIYADLGADGVFFCEDWGTQERLLVSPRMWADLFRPGFERLIGHCHSRGLTVWMHSCGYVRDIIPPLVELGLDVFQFDQPDLHGLDWLAQFHGRTTYWCPVDIQTTLQCGDREVIHAKAREMVDKLGRGGGFIAKDYGDNHSIGCDPLWQHWGYEAFLEYGTFCSGS
jgi:hypothetical protein